jgi:hypothetical protein
MRVEIVQGVPRLHETPLATIRVMDGRIVVELDDENENRFALTFQPYQALRVITADCFFLSSDLEIRSGMVMEIFDSDWISKLGTNLRCVDEDATFLDKARHFLVPLQDSFCEIVAWDIATS